MVTVSEAECFSDASACFLPPKLLLLLLHSCASGPSRITPDMIISLAVAPGALKDALACCRGLHSPSATRETTVLSGQLVIPSVGEIRAASGVCVFQSFREN